MLIWARKSRWGNAWLAPLLASLVPGFVFKTCLYCFLYTLPTQADIDGYKIKEATLCKDELPSLK